MAVGETGASPQALTRGGGCLWLQLLTDLCRRLELGAFDHRFPGELALAQGVPGQQAVGCSSTAWSARSTSVVTV